MKAFLVLGPESSGTRLATSILINAGCHGSSEHIQPFDVDPIPANLDPVVWRRSTPHGEAEEWISTLGVQNYILNKLSGRKISAVVTVRDWDCTILSQLGAPHVWTVKEATKNVQKSYTAILSFLWKHSIDYRMLVYESLIQSPELSQKRLLESLGLAVPEKLVSIVDGNAKYNTFERIDQYV